MVVHYVINLSTAILQYILLVKVIGTSLVGRERERESERERERESIQLLYNTLIF